MGVCSFCGKPAGLLISKHKACWEKHLVEAKENADEQRRLKEASETNQWNMFQAQNMAKVEICSAITQFINGPKDSSSVLARIREIALSASISETEYRDLIFHTLNSFVVKSLETGLIALPTANRIIDFMNVVQFSREDVFNNEGFPMRKLLKNEILTNLNLGRIIPYFDVKSSTGINVDRGETAVWVFRDTKLYEDRVHSTRIGGNAGLSLKVHKGVYLHTGGFAARTISHVEQDFIDKGCSLFTDRKIYFAGARKGFKIDYQKIICFEKYPNGICIIKDGTSAKPQYLVTGDAWFTCNLATQLAHYRSKNIT